MIKPWFTNALNEFNTYKDHNKLPHSLIISGNRGIGKQEFAQHIVWLLTGCDVSLDNLAKLDDEILVRHSHYQHLVYIMRERGQSGKVAQTIGVNQVRAFNEFLCKTSNALQIGIIAYSDELTVNASNALLKTLEEPRERTLIILLAHNISHLPITIISRCAQLHLSMNPEDNESLVWINNQLSNQHQLSDIKLKELLQENAYTPPIVVNKILSEQYQAEQQTKEELIAMVHNPTTIFSLTHKENIALILHSLYQLIVSLCKIKLTQQAYTDTTAFVAKTKLIHLTTLLKDVTYAQYLLRTTVNQKLMLDNILIVWSHITHLQQYPTIFTTSD